MGASWRIEERTGGADQLHEGWPTVVADPASRAVGICQVPGPAIVLGSTQSRSVVDDGKAAAAGLAVARRRSGGGAVLVAPGDPIWVDAWVPRGDPLWSGDVARAFDWIGDTWARALGGLGIAGLSVHRGGLAACTQWSSLVCFGGVGTGEVLDADGRKVVGISQRRTRDGAWFHSACVRRWDPGPLLDALALDADRRDEAGVDLAAAAVGIDQLLSYDPAAPRASAGSVVDTFVAALPADA